MAKVNPAGLKGLARSVGGRTARDYAILVVYDGEKTEDDYFRGWKLIIPPSRLTLDTKYVKSGGNVLQAVKAAAKAKRATKNIAECWCVCDVDNSTKEDIAAAIDLAARSEIRLCLSCRCFEVWLLMHFEFSDREIVSEKDAIERVACHCPEYGAPYKTTEFHQLFALTDVAIANAERLESCDLENPRTAVHRLVRKLKQNMAKSDN